MHFEGSKKFAHKSKMILLEYTYFFWPEWWMNSRPHVYVLTKHYVPSFYFDLSFVEKSCTYWKINQASKTALVFRLLRFYVCFEEAIKGVLKYFFLSVELSLDLKLCFDLTKHHICSLFWIYPLRSIGMKNKSNFKQCFYLLK